MTRKTKLISWGQRVGSRETSPPKNSLALVKLAVDAGYDGIELDVRMSKDGVPFLAHDNGIRGPDGTITVSRALCEELARFRVDVRNGEDFFVPTLQEALSLTSGQLVLIDHRGKPEEAAILRGAIDSHGMDRRRLMFCIYDDNRAHAFRQAFPEGTMLFKMPFVRDVSQEHLGKIAELGLDGIMLNRPAFGKRLAVLMDRLRSRHLKVLFYIHGNWNVATGTPSDSLRKMIDAGVDYVTSTESHLVSQLAAR